jgi:hypothetical protein
MRRPIFTALFTLFCLALLSTTGLAQISIPVINSAVVDYGHNTLTVSGTNFGSSPKITLGGVTLAAQSATATKIVANFPSTALPSSFVPGTYFLQITFSSGLFSIFTVDLGANGPIGINNRGAWSSTASYAVKDAVTDVGQFWLAIVANTSSEPSSTNPNWQLLAAEGSTGATGPMGPQGPIGPIGPQGPKGSTGVTGANGAQGPTGSTGAMGVAGPTGPIGAIGPAGAVGATGATGAVGPLGPIGPIGPQGLKGDSGATGTAGAVGPIGPIGPQGLKGDTGAQGAMGTTGLKGDTGATGAQGATGPTGANGTNGTGFNFTGPFNASTSYNQYDVATYDGSSYDATTAILPGGATPDTNSQWQLMAQAGAAGATGAVGPQGPIGFTGATGAQGAQGTIGPQGAKGDTGATGSQGPQGLTGATGPQGTIGPQGPKGDTGATGAQGATGPAGANGTNGTGFNFTGPFNISANYNQYDVATYNGSTYDATTAIASNGGTPDTNPKWQLMAQAGAAGATGAVGAQGPIGFTGAPGAQGPIGATGATGAAGATGSIGLTGASGPAGPQGSPGLFARGRWNNAATYMLNDVVSDQGETWRCAFPQGTGTILFNFTFTGPGVMGSGTFVTSPVSPGTYLISSITGGTFTGGNLNGAQLTLVPPSATGPINAIDNLISPTFPYASPGGTEFLAGTQPEGIFSANGIDYLCQPGSGDCTVNRATPITLTVSSGTQTCAQEPGTNNMLPSGEWELLAAAGSTGPMGPIGPQGFQGPPGPDDSGLINAETARATSVENRLQQQINFGQQPLNGDVVGAPNANFIQTLQGVPLKIGGRTPLDGQVLKFDASLGGWVAGSAGTAGTGTAAGPCADNGNRFVDCGNGTVTDTQTGLIWLTNAGCYQVTDFASAYAIVAALQSGQCGLSDGSAAGSWRLPTQVEWGAVIPPSPRGGVGCTPPVLVDRAGTGCFSTNAGNQWAAGVQASTYWSSTSWSGSPTQAAGADLVNGGTTPISKSGPALVWPVRGGQ